MCVSELFSIAHKKEINNVLNWNELVCTYFPLCLFLSFVSLTCLTHGEVIVCDFLFGDDIAFPSGFHWPPTSCIVMCLDLLQPVQSYLLQFISD